MTFEEFKHRITVQVRFNDIDKVGHVNNACYHTYIELGRVHYLDETLKRDVNWDRRGFVLARTEIDHKVPIYLNDEVYCYTRVSRFGTKSLTILSVISKKQSGQMVICASAVGTLVAMDYEKNVSIEIPEKWRENMSAFEAGPLRY